ncbi:MAG: hypothetical protein LBL66_02755 [Clostridiales bacterium]|nr:hypothetical protein [Clostridiales bacterium]
MEKGFFQTFSQKLSAHLKVREAFNTFKCMKVFERARENFLQKVFLPDLSQKIPGKLTAS